MRQSWTYVFSRSGSGIAAVARVVPLAISAMRYSKPCGMSLAPYPSDEMIAWPVSPRVGNVRNNDSSLIEPVVAA